MAKKRRKASAKKNVKQQKKNQMMIAGAALILVVVAFLVFGGNPSGNTATINSLPAEIIQAVRLVLFREWIYQNWNH